MSMKMSKNKQLILVAGAIFGFTPLVAFQAGRSFFLARSQGEHAERELVGWQDTINLCSQDEYGCGLNYGSFTVQGGYYRSFDSSSLADYFFGNDSFSFSGSAVVDRADSDILADYFGLPPDFKSTVSFNPLVQNEVVDLNCYVGLDELCRGMYFRMHMPFVHTTWDMRISECVTQEGTAPYVAGYMGSAAIPRVDMISGVADWFKGQGAVGDLQPLQYGLINGQRSESGLADLYMVLGWNPFVTDRYHFGFNLRLAVPTSNTSKGVYLFEPMFGNGRHWEFGIGLTGHSRMWESCNGCHRLSLYGDANITHLFGSCQKRSFDFKQNGPVSRYILIESIGSPLIQGLVFDNFTIPATEQYHGAIMPAINQTTLNANISVSIQADIVLKVTYEYGNFAIDFGYDFWGRTGEKIHFREPIESSQFAIKGDATVYGFTTTTNQFVAINATQSEATLHAGQGAGNADHLNTNADNAALIGVDFDLNQVTLGLEGSSSTQINGSNPAIFLTDCDIDNFSALAPSAYTNTLFLHFNYAWDTDRSMHPFIGFGGEVSFDASGGKRKNALSEWGVWLKFGVSC